MSTENQKDAGRKLKILDYVKELETKGNVKNSLIELLKTGVVTGVGIYIGKGIGRPSLLIGLGTTCLGYYTDIPKLTQLGVTVMATAGFQLAEKGVSGTDVGGFEGFKEKAKAVTSSLKHGLYLDKFIKTKEQGTAGLGEVQYFKYPSNENNVGSLEAIEREIERSSERYASRKQSDNKEDFTGVEERLY